MVDGTGIDREQTVVCVEYPADHERGTVGVDPVIDLVAVVIAILGSAWEGGEERRGRTRSCWGSGPRHRSLRVDIGGTGEAR